MDAALVGPQAGRGGVVEGDEQGVVAGRQLSEAEAVELIRDGALSSRQGFVSSKTKKKFAAGLRLSPDFSKTEFVFDNN